MFEVEQASHFNRDIAKGYPTGTEFVGSGAQIDQVVVSTRAVVRARMGEANDLALMQVGSAFQKLLVKVPEARHSAKILVCLRTDDLKKRFRSRKEGLKEMLTEIQNNVSLKEPFQPEVAVLAIGFPQLLQGETRVSRLKPTQSLRCYVQYKAITDQRLAEISHTILF